MLENYQISWWYLRNRIQLNGSEDFKEGIAPQGKESRWKPSIRKAGSLPSTHSGSHYHLQGRPGECCWGQRGGAQMQLVLWKVGVTSRNGKLKQDRKISPSCIQGIQSKEDQLQNHWRARRGGGKGWNALLNPTSLNIILFTYFLLNLSYF